MTDYCLNCGDKAQGVDNGEYHTFYNMELGIEVSIWICTECASA